MKFEQFEVFSHDNLGSVRTTYNQADESIWFVLADVCRILGISNPSKAAQRLDDDELVVISNPTGKGAQTINIVNESGLYNIIFRSRKEEAKVFRKWVTSVVLPAIRINGSYSLAQEKDAGLECERLRQQVTELQNELSRMQEENTDLLAEYRVLFEQVHPKTEEDVVVTKEGFVFSKSLWEALNEDN